jgi:hypothetical protein
MLDYAGKPIVGLSYKVRRRKGNKLGLLDKNAGPEKCRFTKNLGYSLNSPFFIYSKVNWTMLERNHILG